MTNFFIVKAVLFIVLVINISGFIIVRIDKYKAKKHLWRIPEKRFFILAFLGGCPGIYFALRLFNHKTKHKKFMLGIPLIFIIQVFIVLFFLYKINFQ